MKNKKYFGKKSEIFLLPFLIWSHEDVVTRGIWLSWDENVKKFWAETFQLWPSPECSPQSGRSGFWLFCFWLRQLRPADTQKVKIHCNIWTCVKLAYFIKYIECVIAPLLSLAAGQIFKIKVVFKISKFSINLISYFFYIKIIIKHLFKI